jgi:hypothetical protein
MPRRFRRCTGAAARASRALLAALLAALALEAAAQPPVEPAPPARLTVELAQATLAEAAARLSQLLGVRVRLASLAEAAQHDAPPLNLSRRASLSLKDRPLPDALRAFCRAFDCRLAWDVPAGYVVLPGPFPTGPEARIGEHAVSVTGITLAEDCTLDEDKPDFRVRRGLSLQLAIRALSGDPASIYGLENVRVVDDQGRDALDLPADRVETSPLGHTAASPFSDERSQTVAFAWPYPAPRRLSVIEGDLVLYRSVRRLTLQLPLPPPGAAPVARELAGVRLQLSETGGPGEEAGALVRFDLPPGTDLEVSGAPARALLLLQDGTRLPARFEPGGWGLTDGWRTVHYTLRLPTGRARPVRMLWNVALKSDATVRRHFRFTAYPAVLATGAKP